MSKPKAYKLAKAIEALQGELRRHQDSRCKHPADRRLYRLRSNTGNYDPTSDCYWTEYHCELCLKSWTVDGQENLVGRRQS